MKNIFSISKAVRTKTPRFLMVAVVLMTTSCQDLSEINKSPNQLSANEINIKYVLTSVLSGTGRDYLYEYAYPGGWTVSEAMQYLQRDYIDFQSPNTRLLSTACRRAFRPRPNEAHISSAADTINELVSVSAEKKGAHLFREVRANRQPFARANVQYLEFR